MATSFTNVFSSNFTPNASDVNRDIWTTPEWHAALASWPSWNPGFLGRTSLRNPNTSAWGAQGEVPIDSNGNAQLFLGTYNNFNKGSGFTGSQIGTRAYFGSPAATAVKYEAKVSFPSDIPGGAVMSFYTYGLLDVCLNTATCTAGCRDEIDIEFASNCFENGTITQVNTNMYVNNGDPSGNDQVVTFPTPITLAGEHTLTIIWKADSVEWLIDGTSIRIADTAGDIPIHGMGAVANIWVPASDWAWAYNAGLQPASSAGVNNENLTNWAYLINDISVYYQM